MCLGLCAGAAAVGLCWFGIMAAVAANTLWFCRVAVGNWERRRRHAVVAALDVRSRRRFALVDIIIAVYLIIWKFDLIILVWFSFLCQCCEPSCKSFLYYPSISFLYPSISLPNNRHDGWCTWHSSRFVVGRPTKDERTRKMHRPLRVTWFVFDGNPSQLRHMRQSWSTNELGSHQASLLKMRHWNL